VATYRSTVSTQYGSELVAKTAVVAGICGILSTVPVAPVLQALCLLLLVLTGVGSAVMCWVDLPPAPLFAALVGISITSAMSLAVVMAWVGIWYPVVSCLLLSAGVLCSGCFRVRSLRRTSVKASLPC
jgi:CHASE2 domain-containing sensor protein